MSDNGMELTRRKILAGAGAVGVAGAAAGFGSSAFFSDQETFTNNQLVAGELDLKVDWEEHYSDWSADEDDPADSADPALDIAMDEPGTPADYTAFPPGVEAFSGDPGDDFVTGDPLLWVHNDDVSQFMDNTAIEAFPDSDDDGIQDDFNEDDVCSNDLLANTPEDLDPTESLRTEKGPQSPRGEATIDGNGNPLPLVNIADIKPGDFGEVTFSFHLCDNPGYVWLQGRPVTAAENDWTEPEAEDSDEMGSADESYNVNDGDDPSDILNSNVELLDAIQTAWWYDNNCNNLTDGGGGDGGAGKVDIAFLMDRSGSMSDERDALATNISQVAQNISADAQFALVPYENNTTTNVTDSVVAGTGSDCVTFIEEPLTTTASDLDFNYGTCGGDEDASEAIVFALDNLSWRNDAQKVVVVLTDEDDDGTLSQRETAIDRLNGENACLLAISRDSDGSDELKTMATGTINGKSVNCGDWIEITAGDGLDQQVLTELTNFIGTVAGGGESIFFQGSLRDALSTLTAGNGVPLAGDIPAEQGGGGDGSCFSPSSTHCIGFSWWLPVDHANEIQSDSVGFDVGFYTEQCRHNNGGGEFGNARGVGNT